jgi:hypothetical protein
MVSVKESITIRADIRDVWDVFSRVEEWPSWQDGCLEAAAPQSLKRGAQLHLSIKFGFVPIKFPVTIIRCDPPYELTWIGRGGGLKGVHSWRFVPDGEKTQATQCEEYSGPGLVPFFLAGQVGAARRMFRKSLEGLKALTEAKRGGAKGKLSLLADALRRATRR